MGFSSYDYLNRRGIRDISWKDFHRICKALATAIYSYKPDWIMPIGRGGYYPGTLIAHMLQIEIYPIRISRRVNDLLRYEKPRWIIEPPEFIKDQRILIVDEICSTGQTMSMVKEEIEKKGVSHVKSAVLYAHSRSVDIPDYIGVITDELIVNPWDREIMIDGVFQLHPEYTKAIADQDLKLGLFSADQEKPFQLAKARE